MSDMTKNNFFQRKMTQTDEKVGEKCFPSDFSGFRASLTRSLPKSFQKQDLLCMLVRTAWGVNNFRNTSAMRLNLFFKMFNI